MKIKDEHIDLMKKLEHGRVPITQFSFGKMVHHAAECIELARKEGLDGVCEALEGLPHMNRGIGRGEGAHYCKIAYDAALDAMFDELL